MALASETVYSGDQMRAEKRAVASNSVFVAVAITGFKIVVGATTGSLGILSEAAHSGLDLVAAVITLFSVRVSDKPADADHPYGHGKFENFSAFIETALLLITCLWILWEAMRRLLGFRTVEIEPSIAAFVVMFFSICMDWWRSHALKKIADKYDSQALHADALHFRTDIWSSTVVIIGLALVTLGNRFHLPKLKYADPLAALAVAVVVVQVSWRLGRQTLDALLDAAPVETRTRIIDVVNSVSGVLEVDRVRIRRAGNRYFVDLTLGLLRNVTFQHSQQVVAHVMDRVHEILPGSDVIVHSVPRAPVTENIFDRIRAVASEHNFIVHDVSVQDLNGNLHVEQHLELDEKLSLKDAHEQVTLLESEIRDAVPEIASILTHIESEPAKIESGGEPRADWKFQQRLQAIAKAFKPEVIDIHEVQVKRVRDRVYVSCHCTMEDDLPLARVHEIATDLETRFKQEQPGVFKVLIHAEPMTDNRR